LSERSPDFLNKYDNFEKQYLTADFSPRKYFRWINGGSTFVLMDCPNIDSLKAFMRMDKYLISQGLSAPEIIEADEENGYLLLEDFGDATYTKVLQTSPQREQELYTSAVDVLIHLQERSDTTVSFVKDYTVEFGLTKVEQFLLHYYPKVMNEDVSEIDKNSYLNSWKSALELALQTKKSIFMRDYHVDNLMDLKERARPKNVGLLDFQDAVWAPVAGDLVSLLEDARREVSVELTNHLWKRFLDAHPKGDHQEIYVAGLILSAVRHARILGLFTKVAVERGDKRFLKQIPHLWNMLNRCCLIEELKPVRQWFDIHVPNAKRVIPIL
jgi:aminoglycoside/choline kinase family phosphotransferase